MKKVAILQSNYIPWKGYFDMIAAVDEFILYDDVQFTKNDWRNRNKIKTAKGSEWVSIPVGQNISRLIKDVTIKNSSWQKKHWNSIEANYHKALFFNDIALWLQPLFLDVCYTNLSSLNRHFITSICDYLGINTTISNSWDYTLTEGKTERLVNLCLQAGGTEYISGPSAQNYIEEDIFTKNSIKFTWFNYSGYPEYPQCWGDFIHEVTILDLLFNCGKNAYRYMRHVRS